MRRRRGRRQSAPVNPILPSEGFARLPVVLAVVGMSKSSWWRGVKAGIYPKPVQLGPGTVGWKVTDIRDLIVKLEAGAVVFAGSASLSS